MKHRHSWKLHYTNADTCGRGLLWSCDCGNCLEISKKKPNIKQVSEVYQREIDDLCKILDKLIK